MNPLGLLLALLGVFLIIIGIKGSQHQVIAALLNRPAKSS